MIIRPIQKEDNQAIAQVIRKVLIEYNVPKVGTAYADPQLDSMFETYSTSQSVYFVIENIGQIIGGAGVSHLENEADTICELQKMYFLPEARGMGLGTQMMEKCLQSARDFGYKKCYLETMPNMEDAQKLYQKVGFEYLCNPLGNTGHTSCPVWMIKAL
jgi:putative acetyltransferase